MSAFVVGKKTIDTVLNGIESFKSELIQSHYSIIDCDVLGIKPFDDDCVNELGNKIMDLNVRSVNARYGESHVWKPVKFHINTTVIFTPQYYATIIKCLHCIEYQSCEIEKYSEDPVYQLLETLEKFFLNKLYYAEWDRKLIYGENNNDNSF